MTTAIETAAKQESSLVREMAEKYGLEPAKFYSTVVGTLFPSETGKQPTQEQVAMFLIVANKYSLNPFIREIYAFPSKRGGIIPVVSVDGWITTVQRNPYYDGHQFEDKIDVNGSLIAVTCNMFRKDRAHPIAMTEYMGECRRDTDPWKQWPYRMLHHKAFIQAARYAFGLSGIYDEDEAERILDVEGAVSERRPAIPQPQRLVQAQPVQAVPTPQEQTAAPTPEPVPAPTKKPEPEQRTLEPLPGPQDELLSPKEREMVIQTGFKMGWALHELKAYLQKHYNVQAVGDVKKSQLEGLLSEIGQGGRP